VHTVIVDGDISYPPTSGKRLRTLHLMLGSARRHRVTYLARGDAHSAEAKQARLFLGDHGIEAILVDHPVPKKSGLAFAGRLASNLLSPLPYSVTSHHSEAMRQAVGEYGARNKVDIWQFEWLPYMFTLKQPGKRVVQAHNVEALIWQRYYENARGLARRFFLRQQWQKMERFERTFLPQADWVVAVSEPDARLIRENFHQPRVDVVDNGIDSEYFASVQPNPAAPQVLFLGALDWRPNLDALDLLLDQVFPRLIAQEPTARLTIVGRHPPVKLRERIQQLPGVSLCADVPDVRPFLAQSGVMVVPLRIGGGSRLKILEALASGLPVISTAVGAEGLDLQPGHDYVQANAPEEMAEALVRGIRQPQPLREMAQRARPQVLKRYDWDTLAGRLEQVWEKCLCQGANSTCTLSS
jgi:glycosyltransferase involved in cell wall biosynthesis